MTERVEYGVRIDCAKEGCKPPHSDDNEVKMSRTKTEWRKTTTINGHAAKRVKRTVTYGEWQ